ncbi:DUF605-domain-containing protein [Saccharata proteae CBS 121410]|uniref:DUF605-domain-containing protein n=1 Tax=Saccharata proteae CBS 121410 TaxID=1314787 RepID=A0A9P4HLV7_9PEZI|nr:DUF605-domain-containing protein [Saccharata proteae CBS 121410]
MTSKVPAGLKAADISRFALRATQLENVMPAISYWCEYHIVNQILNKGLHTTDTECMTYTTTLMDKLEQTKEKHSDEDAIHDDVAARAYVEQFALQTFQRADNAVRANKASAQTADTFRAAATFIDLITTWGPLDPDLASKSKFAKYHALRIAKALKSGEDPNLSNPSPEPEPFAAEDSAPALDPNDPEVQRINGTATQGLHATVEDEFAAPAGQDYAPEAVYTSEAAQHPHDVSPMDIPEERRASAASSVGGGYFPAVPTFTSEIAAPSMPTADDEHMANNTPGAPAAPLDPRDYYQPPPPPALAPTAVPPPSAPVPSVNESVALPLGAYKTDEDAVMQAQKHAKWAISALNFEDVPTAVEELRVALRALGAS